MLEEPDINEAGFSDQAHMNASIMGFVDEEIEDEKKEEPFTKDITPIPRPKKQERRGSVLNQSMRDTYSEAEERTVIKVLNQISATEQKEYKKGFNNFNFTAGVMNSFFVAYAFGAFPQHFWLVYLVESCYFIPSKFWNMISAKPLNNAFYYFDFCWMMNFNIILFLALVISPLPIDPEWRRFLFRGAYGIAIGPLLGATLILPFVAVVFHDLNTMTNVVIHGLPPMMLYTMRWYADEIREAWPDIFQLEGLTGVDYFPSLESPLSMSSEGFLENTTIAGATIVIYLMWWIPYTSWMLLIGMDLPRKDLGRVPKYDTVFHSFWRAGTCEAFGTMFWKRPKEKSAKQMETDHYEVRDFMVYMGIHAALIFASIPTLGYACNYSKETHMAVMMLVMLAVVHRGSQRYTYYTTKMYSRMIKKQFLAGKK